MSYIYLASVYSLDAPATTIAGRAKRLERYHVALEHLAFYTKKGEIVFSPIVHSHPLCAHDIRGDFHFWEKVDYAFIDHCDILRVLKMDGFERSVGVQSEIKYAIRKRKEIQYAELCV